MRNEETKSNKTIYVARQPIFQRNRQIYGYELLYRSGNDNFFDRTINQDYASSKTMVDSFLLFEINELTREKKAFINLTHENLLKDYISALPQGIVVAELLETIEPDNETIAICKKLKNKGYTLALDDFVLTEKYYPLIDIADIIKVDFKQVRGLDRQKIISEIGSRRVKFLAEKVETAQEFDEAAGAGYTYFQGYFFCRPVILSRQDLPSFKHQLLLLLQELVNPELSISRIEAIMQKDVSLSYKLLRFINSAAFGFFQNIKSIRHAINLIGIEDFKKWMSVIVMTQMCSDQPDELALQSITRAKFCEMAADQTPLLKRKSEAFLMGMFSLLETMMGMHMGQILEQLPLADDIKGALLGEPNSFKDFLDLATAFERADWNSVSILGNRIKLDEIIIPDFYSEALRWANCLGED